MENCIKTYGLEMAESQEYDAVYFDLYADYEKNCMLLGRRVVYRPIPLDNLGAKRVVKESDICCVLKFNLNEEGLSDSLKEAVSEAINSPVFYKIRLNKDRSFIHLYEEGFAKIPNEKAYGNKSDTMMGPNNVQMITGYIEEQMRMLNSLNVPSFKSVLSDWVKNHPDTLFDDREKSEPVYDAMLFIKDWQLLLLSEDKELRDLYLEYMKKYSACYCARMTMDR
ncbi:hypothetical protein [Butyrivibrio sp. AE3009]|uniref:hypothetical protein n=1 Tax=Butyrivibrio sp. AE3009 TaxID=1280666 RepID=UPI0012DD4225|nr:hypothetical protein [Butyrivibrio sp. AE3009]